MELELNSFKKLDTFTLSSTSVVAEFKFGGDVEDVTDAVENIASSFGDSSHYEIRLLMKKLTQSFKIIYLCYKYRRTKSRPRKLIKILFGV